MTFSANAPDQGALSVDDAIAALDAAEPQEAAAEPEEQASAPEPEDDEPDAVEPEDAPVEEPDEEGDPDALASEEEEETETDEPALPAIDPPVSWDAAHKARFAQLPREDQEYLAQREQQREVVVNTANERASRAEASVNQRVELERAQFVAQYKPALDQLVTNAEAKFKSDWERVDWAALREADPVQFLVAKDAYAAEQHELQQAKSAQQAAAFAAEDARHQQFVQAESQKIPQFVPELADPVHGAERKQQLTAFLTGRGVSADEQKWITANHISIAYDAMLYRQFVAAQQRAQSAPPQAPKPSLVPAGRPVRPRSVPATGSSITRQYEQARERLTRSGSTDDAVAALDALDAVRARKASR